MRLLKAFLPPICWLQSSCILHILCPRSPPSPRAYTLAVHALICTESGRAGTILRHPGLQDSVFAEGVFGTTLELVGFLFASIGKFYDGA